PVGANRRSPQGEHRWAAAAAVLVAIALNGVLSDPLLVGPRFVIPAIGLLLFIPLVATNPHRLTKQTRTARVSSLVLVTLLGVANHVSLVRLITELVNGSQYGAGLLVGALLVFLTNIIVYGLVYW